MEAITSLGTEVLGDMKARSLEKEFDLGSEEKKKCTDVHDWGDI